jgi:hypothetical protein
MPSNVNPEDSKECLNQQRRRFNHDALPHREFRMVRGSSLPVVRG